MEGGWTLLQNPEILCCDSPMGIGQRFPTAVAFDRDASSTVGSAGSSARGVCTAGFFFSRLYSKLVTFEVTQ